MGDETAGRLEQRLALIPLWTIERIASATTLASRLPRLSIHSSYHDGGKEARFPH